MGSRLILQTRLEDILGSRNVYFQPPESVKINYPAIVYSVDGIENIHANGIVYMQEHSYQITVIDEDPDSDIAKTLSTLPMCRFVRQFKSENLNHYIFILYF